MERAMSRTSSMGTQFCEARRPEDRSRSTAACVMRHARPEFDAQ